MSGRERLLTALSNKKPDRMACQVHSWMQYYLKNFLDDKDQFEAYDYYKMDPVIYSGPTFNYDSSDLANWQESVEQHTDEDGIKHFKYTITTPGGALTRILSSNKFTTWDTEHLIKTEADFEIWEKYNPRPTGVDWSPIIEVKKRIGDSGIVRGAYYDFGQGSPWQSFSSVLFGTEPAIYECYDNRDWVHHIMSCLLERKLRVIELGGENQLDLVETGGGGGSSTVISPDMHKEFCLPYDIKQHDAFREHGTKTVYHLCGGLMPLLETVVENRADALETMTPPEMGGDCDLAEATRRVGDKIAFIGGFNQSEGFEKGTPEVIKKMVFDLHKACPDGGYICSPSDHFFFGERENIQAFVNACNECYY